MMQILAIFLDAYRSLNAKKMFWIVLAISLLVVASFLLVGINERGVKVAIWQFNSPVMNTNFVPPALFYKFLLLGIGFPWYLAWLATILALVSTAGIFPDLITSGSIDLLVSKPIGRLKLFLAEYTAGLLFVTLQVTAFCLGSFLVLGLRGGTWEPGVFVAVPLMVVFFSYLFSVCVFLGMVTRSTVAALLLTLLFWFGVFAIDAVEYQLLREITMKRERVDRSEMWHGPNHGRRPRETLPIERNGGSVNLPGAKPDAQSAEDARPIKGTGPADGAGQEKSGVKVTRAVGKSLLKAAVESMKPEEQREKKASPNASAKAGNEDREEDEGNEFATLEATHKIVYGLKTVLPKTSETVKLLERTLIDMAELPEPRSDRRKQRARVWRKTEETIRARSVAWVIGTSLAFEFAVLACAAWIFCRRDY